MSKLPKLKVKNSFGEPSEDICELEQAKCRFFDHPQDVLFLVEGQVVSTSCSAVPVHLTFRSISAPVGQASTQAAQNWHPESRSGRLKAVPISAWLPRKVKAMAPEPLTS